MSSIVISNHHPESSPRVFIPTHHTESSSRISTLNHHPSWLPHGCSWLLLAGSWLAPAASGCPWLLPGLEFRRKCRSPKTNKIEEKAVIKLCIFLSLATNGSSGCSWLLLAAPGCAWLPLAAPGCSWLLLAVPGNQKLHPEPLRPSSVWHCE